jgi:hypothetical protein
MAYATEFKFTLTLGLESKAEENAAHGTIESFVTAQSGKFRWTARQGEEGEIKVSAVLLLPVADRSEVHSKCNTIESSLDSLPRDGDCVKNCEIVIVQKGLPGTE